MEDVDGGTLHWELEPSHFPQPLTRWSAELFVVEQTAAIRELSAEFGLLADGIAMREIDGRVYTTLVPLGGKARKPPPAFLVPLLCRIVPELRHRIARLRRAEETGAWVRILDEWAGGGEAALLADLRAELATDLEALDDDALADAVVRARALGIRGIDQHFRLHGAGLAAVGRLGMRLSRDHGWAPSDVAGLFTGLSTASTGPAAGQQEIIDLVAAAAGGADVLPTADSLDDLRAVSPDVAAAVDRYLHDWGSRAIRYEVAYPTIGERPEWLLQALRDQAGRPHGDELAGRHAARRADLATRAVRDLGGDAAAEGAVEAAQRAYPVREGNETATVGVPVAVLRRVGLEVGRRLAVDGRLERPDDVFDLEIDEVLAVLRRDPAAPPDPAAVAATRRDRRLAVATRPPLPWHGAPPSSPPDLRGFPTVVADTVAALVWYSDHVSGIGTGKADATAPQDEGATQTRGQDGRPQAPPTSRVQGIGAGPGTYAGPVRVLLDEGDFGKLEPGDVLVCPITSPVWSMLFPLVGALVCDAGGLLSHPAIIAREFGIPAVVGTGSGTTELTDRMVVLVDGDAGTVTVVEEAVAPVS